MSEPALRRGDTTIELRCCRVNRSVIQVEKARAPFSAAKEDTV